MKLKINNNNKTKQNTGSLTQDCDTLPFCTLKHGLISFAEFVWIWANTIALYTSQFILLPRSAVTWSIHTSDSISLVAISVHGATLPPPYLSDNVACFWSWAVSFLLHIFFPSFKLVLVLPVQRFFFSDLRLFLMLSGEVSSSLVVFKCNQWFAACYKPSPATFMKTSVDYRL